MRHATLTVEIRPSMTIADMFWVEAFYRGEMIAQTNNRCEADGIADAMHRSAPIMRERGYALKPPKVLALGERYDRDATYPHEDF